MPNFIIHSSGFLSYSLTILGHELKLVKCTESEKVKESLCTESSD